MTAAGDDFLIVDHIQTTVRIQHHTVTHSFIVVNTLVTPAILGIDFLQQHGIIIDFASSPINISIPPVADSTVIDPCLKSVLEAERTVWTKHCCCINFQHHALNIRWKIMQFQYFLRHQQWNFRNVRGVIYRQLFMNSSNSSKQPRVRLMLLTITSLPQAHQFAYIQNVFRSIIEMKC